MQNGRKTSSGQQAIARDASHGQDTAIRREAPPVAEDKQYGRKASPGQGISNNREHGHFPTAAFRCASFRRSERWPTSLVNPNWSDTPPLGYMAVCRDFPFALSSHSLPFRSTSGESELLACAGATAP
jgi:hypothetical protein